MGTLRTKIRGMIQTELATRLLSEAGAGHTWKSQARSDRGIVGPDTGARHVLPPWRGKSVYRASKYIDFWKNLPKGSPSTEVSAEASKHDFVRRFMKMLKSGQSSTEAVYLEPEYLEKAEALLTPLMDNPDEFIEALNKERELVFGSLTGDNLGGNLRSAPDPVMVLLQRYISDKDMRTKLSSMEFPTEEQPDPDAESDVDAPKGPRGEYDIIPGATSKADIARMLASDPSETTTEMSVGNRLEKAMEHLSKDRNLEILEFIKDPKADKKDKAELIADLAKIVNLSKRAVTGYSTLFVDSMISALKGVKDVENDAEVDKAILKGRDTFVAALKDKGVFTPARNRDTMNPNEINVFTDVLDKQEGRWTVLEMLLIAAKKPGQAATYRDEAIAIAAEMFEEESEKQTNFNTLGDYTDSLPEMQEIRTNLFKTLVKRGRKPGSTAAVLAARRAKS